MIATFTLGQIVWLLFIAAMSGCAIGWAIGYQLGSDAGYHQAMLRIGDLSADHLRDLRSKITRSATIADTTGKTWKTEIARLRERTPEPERGDWIQDMEVPS